ncbi:MAG: hypothetical protein LKH93_15355 [Clostridium beijerinckii]|jgi:hypothetical protein|nr:hypothetical protein [Clostridium beijerinckii]MCI1623579.1 hypothetical protein [Clostridium beijerinckii]
MDISTLRNKLQEKGFYTSNYTFKREVVNILKDNSIEIWQKDNRIIALKEYINEFHFKNWIDNDKIVLVAILKLLSNEEKNNLYFLINLDINNNKETNFSLLEEINKLEKDSKICKKYVLDKQEDIERIPFLANAVIRLPQMLDYENKFKYKLKNISNITERALKISMEYFNN